MISRGSFRYKHTLFFESLCSQRAREVRRGRESDQTEQAEFQLVQEELQCLSVYTEWAKK